MIPVLAIFASVFLRTTLNSVYATGLCRNDNEELVSLPPSLSTPVPPPFDKPVYHRLYMVTPLQLDASGKYNGIQIPDDINVCSCVSFLTKGQRKCGSAFVRSNAIGGSKARVHSLNNYVSDKMNSTVESIKQFDAVPGATKRIMKGGIQKLRDYVVGGSNEKVYQGTAIPEILRENQSQVHCSFDKTNDYYISRTDNGKFTWVFVDDKAVEKTSERVRVRPDVDAAIQSSLTRIVGPTVRDQMVKVELYGENGGTKLEKHMFSDL